MWVFVRVLIQIDTCHYYASNVECFLGQSHMEKHKHCCFEDLWWAEGDQEAGQMKKKASSKLNLINTHQSRGFIRSIHKIWLAFSLLFSILFDIWLVKPNWLDSCTLYVKAFMIVMNNFKRLINHKLVISFHESKAKSIRKEKDLFIAQRCTYPWSQNSKLCELFVSCFSNYIVCNFVELQWTVLYFKFQINCYLLRFVPLYAINFQCNSNWAKCSAFFEILFLWCAPLCSCVHVCKALVNFQFFNTLLTLFSPHFTSYTFTLQTNYVEIANENACEMQRSYEVLEAIFFKSHAKTLLSEHRFELFSFIFQ